MMSSAQEKIEELQNQLMLRDAFISSRGQWGDFVTMYPPGMSNPRGTLAEELGHKDSLLEENLSLFTRITAHHEHALNRARIETLLVGLLAGIALCLGFLVIWVMVT